MKNLFLVLLISTTHSIKSPPIIQRLRHRTFRYLGGSNPIATVTGRGSCDFISFRIFGAEQKTDSGTPSSSSFSASRIICEGNFMIEDTPSHSYSLAASFIVYLNRLNYSGFSFLFTGENSSLTSLIGEVSRNRRFPGSSNPITTPSAFSESYTDDSSILSSST